MSAHPYSPLVLGVDPDVEAPGVALYHARRGCLVYCGALGLRAFVAWLRAGADPAALGVATPSPGAAVACARVEDTRDRPLYARRRAAAASPEARDRMARSIGRLDEVTRLILDELAEAGIPARSCAPVRKLDAEAFKRTTHWPGRTGQEARDAGMLCWGAERGRPRFTNLTPTRRCKLSPRRVLFVKDLGH